MTEITQQLDELSKRTDKAFNLLNNYSDVIIGEIAKTNKLGEITYEHIDKFKKLEKIIYDLQSKISDQDKKIDLLTNTLKTKRSRESEPEPKPVTKKAKIRDEYIERLKSGRGKSREWSPGMSKYSSVSYNSTINKWHLVSNIFDENISFKSRIEAETYYEKILAKYDIPVEYIIRREYDEEKDIYEEEIEEEIVEEEIVEEEEEKSASKNIRDEYIDRLKNGRGKSREWSPGMSKYSSVSYNSTIDKWCWNSNIFDGNITYFKTKNEAENHYEKILDKYNIPVEYIIRRGYNKDKDED